MAQTHRRKQDCHGEGRSEAREASAEALRGVPGVSQERRGGW